MRFSGMFVYNYLLNVVILDIGYKIAKEVNILSSPCFNSPVGLALFTD
jgi:hypothetical protein